MNPFRDISLVLFIGLTLSWLGCGQESPSSQPPTQPPAAAPTSAPPATEVLKTRATERLQAYYDALEAEQIDVEAFFAPTVERFFDARDMSREQVRQSLQRSFEQNAQRELRLDASSVELTETDAGYEVVFRGEAITTEGRSAFRNRVIFNRDWRIIHYTPAQSSRGLPAQSQNRVASGMMSAATRTLEAFQQGNFTAIRDLVHPELGYYYLYSPGALDAAQHFSSLDDLRAEAPWMGEGMPEIDTRPMQAPLPSFSCRDFFSKEGCFLQALDQPFDGISTLQQQLVQADIISPDAINTDRVQRIEQAISTQVIDTDAYLAFYFGQIEGQWYLLVVDQATYDCSA